MNNDAYNNKLNVDTVKELEHAISNSRCSINSVTDADTILADIVANADMEVTGMADELIDLHSAAKDPKDVEKVFYTMTGVEWNTFISRSISAMEQSLKKINNGYEGKKNND